MRKLNRKENMKKLILAVVVLSLGYFAMAKAEATAHCREVCKLSRNVMGGNGILTENKAMKMLTDIEAIHTYEGTHEINSLVSGREMTGLSAIR